MQSRKRNVAAVLFSFYFLLYVLTPFCFTIDGLTDNNESNYQLNVGIKNIRVVWQLFLSGPDTQEDAGGSGHNVQRLIRKARALVKTNSIVKYTPSESAEFVFNDIDFSPKSCISSARYTIPESLTGFHLTVTGLSPPYFS